MAAPEWPAPEYEALIDRLVADLATARGFTVPQMRMYYCLPGRPPMHRPATEAP